MENSKENRKKLALSAEETEKILLSRELISKINDKGKKMDRIFLKTLKSLIAQDDDMINKLYKRDKRD